MIAVLPTHLVRRGRCAINGTGQMRRCGTWIRLEMGVIPTCMLTEMDVRKDGQDYGFEMDGLENSCAPRWASHFRA